MNKRILVTGSRNWSDWITFNRVLDYHSFNEVLDFDTLRPLPPGLATIVHGWNPNGADKMARWYAGGRVGVEAEGHAAMWEHPCTTGCYHRPRFKNGKPYCPLQGHYRNQLMVDLGADVCLAFPLGESRGTRDCMKRAERAGIRVINYGDD